MKRIFDIFIALIVSILFLPLLLLTSLFICIFIGRPILFSQIRPGLEGRPFLMYKFRTMSLACNSNGELLSDDLRLSKFGKLLRSTSIDELPGLWNVLKGDMSLIGPRPLLMEYLTLYNPTQARRHEVRPGITGWAQVNGRNALSWEQKFELDVWYVDNRSFWLDLKILILTVKKVFIREGISADGHVTIEKFKGSKL